jgi:DNA-binding NarL/FixJ family response regulator
MFMTTRILVADDHPVVRRGLKNLLGRHPGWEVIDEAEDGVEAVEKASRLLPDIIVLDITMPKMSGLEACRHIRKTAPASEILFLTQHDSPQMMREAIEAGGRGYVVKSSAARELLPALEALSRHEPLPRPRRHRSRPG